MKWTCPTRCSWNGFGSASAPECNWVGMFLQIQIILMFNEYIIWWSRSDWWVKACRSFGVQIDRFGSGRRCLYLITCHKFELLHAMSYTFDIEHMLIFPCACHKTQITCQKEENSMRTTGSSIKLWRINLDVSVHDRVKKCELLFQTWWYENSSIARVK